MLKLVYPSLTIEETKEIQLTINEIVKDINFKIINNPSHYLIDGIVDYTLQIKQIQQHLNETTQVYNWFCNSPYSISIGMKEEIRKSCPYLQEDLQKNQLDYKEKINSYQLKFKEDQNYPIYRHCLLAKETYERKYKQMELILKRIDLLLQRA